MDPSHPQDPIFMALRTLWETGPIGALRRGIMTWQERREDRAVALASGDGPETAKPAEPEAGQAVNAPWKTDDGLLRTTLQIDAPANRGTLLG
ncbi:MAG TPA: hypothetical protein VD767_06305 [Thermomicrobiales bacterium]|nr:hypothetical protein [Thermomicrobiales bacterium]